MGKPVRPLPASVALALLALAQAAQASPGGGGEFYVYEVTQELRSMRARFTVRLTQKN